MTETDANAILPQHHCRNTDDHPAHDHRAGTVYCPGRYTPRGFVTNAPIAHPMDLDPFAGCEPRDTW